MLRVLRRLSPACAGFLTHYHFLFFACAVSLVCACVLLARLDFPALLWGALACAIGMYAALRIFPDMRTHLIGSDRALESLASATGFLSGGAGPAFARARGYLALAFRHVPALAAVLALAIVRLVSRARRSRACGGRGAEEVSRARSAAVSFPPGFVALFALPLALLFAVVSITTPFLSLRYVASYVPALSVLLAVALTRLWNSFRSPRSRALAAALSLAVAASSLVRPMPAFHDEYAADRDPSYFADDAPVIIVSERQGFAWKNLLPYLSIPRHKRVYVTMRYDGGDMRPSLEGLARDSGSREAYAMVDVLFPAQPSMERVGFYGFFAVYRITRRDE